MSIDISQIHAICFDVDGTLSDTDDQMVAQLTNLLRPFQFMFPGKDLNRVARGIVMEAETPANFLFGIPDLVGLDDEIVAIKDWVIRLTKMETKPFKLIPGIRELLQKLNPHFPLAIVSARDRNTTMQFLEQYNLEGFFSSIATGQTCEHTKPFADPIIWAAGKMGVTKENCLMVGDTTMDIRAGKAAGAQTVGVLCGFGQAKELRDLGADVILNTTPELANLLGF